MGNATTRYVSNGEAIDILGGQDKWNALKSKLERIAGKYVDYRMFCTIIQRRYEKIPRVLCEALFRAFAADLSRRVDIEVFLSTYAVIDSLGSDQSGTGKPNKELLSMQMKCLFRIYEEVEPDSGNGTGMLVRRRIEEMLRVAYGDKLKPHLSEVQRQMDAIFSRYQSTEINCKEFEATSPKLEMLSGWVRSVVRSFELTDVTHTRLYALERRYSAQLNTASLQAQYNINTSVCNNLRKVFFELCRSAVNKEVSLGGEGSEETLNLSVRAELQLKAWMAILTNQHTPTNTTPPTNTTSTTDTTSSTTTSSGIAYLHPTLARVIFNSKVDVFTPKWRFADFVSFCVVYGSGDIELQISSVVDAFIHSALVQYYSNVSSDRERVVYEVNSSSDSDSPFALLSPVGSTSSDVVDSSANTSGVSGVDGVLNEHTLPTVQGVTNSAQVVSVDEYILNALNDMIVVLATPATHANNTINNSINTVNTTATTTTPNNNTTSNRYSQYLHKDILTSLHTLNTTIQPEYYTLAFCDLISTHLPHLPGMRDLMLSACCRFGFNPSSPLREMELCTELSLRYLTLYPQSAVHPYGPEGTEWCVIPKVWYDSWKLYVGHNHHHSSSVGAGSSGKVTSYNSTTNTTTTNTTPAVSTTYTNTNTTYIPASVAGSVLDLDGLTPPSPPQPIRNTAYYSKRNNTTPTTTTTVSTSHRSMKRLPSPPRPGPIDTTPLLRKHTYTIGSASSAIGSRQGQLLPNLVCGRDVEIIAPEVYNALVGWYGGGPRISRCVVRGGDSVSSGVSTSDSGNVVNRNVVSSNVSSGGSTPIVSSSAIPSRPNAAYKGRVGSTIANNTINTSTVTDTTMNMDSTAGIHKVTSPRLTPYNHTNTTITTNSTNTSAANFTIPSELELYPLCIHIHICNNSGMLLPTPLVSNLLFTKYTTIHDICVFLCSTHDIELSKIRLWNYAHSKPEQWREQYVLSPEHTLFSAHIVDGQILMLESSQSDGSWPRAVLQSTLESESGNTSGSGSNGSCTKDGVENVNSILQCSVYFDEYLGTTHTNAASTSTDTPNVYDTSLSGSGTITDTLIDAAASTLSILTGEVNSVLGAPLPSHNKHHGLSHINTNTNNSTNTTPKQSTDTNNNVTASTNNITNTTSTTANTTNTTLTTTQCIQRIRRNNGHVGLDNLGNTCYLNSSLQALLHTQPLVDYFLSYAYTTHINTTSIHGFNGRLAQAYAALVYDVYTTTSSSITPRSFKHNIASMHSQFSGNEQHDAQELLAFLLDGLSEDLNLVHTKPYTIQPDSDHRSDSVLADIWWANHLKRDKSVIQALFSGQFKSTMKCSVCKYNSARFEPFNFISVPVPEEAERVMVVSVVCSVACNSVVCSVRVPKSGTLYDVVCSVLKLGLVGLRGVYCGGTSVEGTTTTTTTNTNTSTSKRSTRAKLNTHTTNSTHTTHTAHTTADPTHYYFQAAELVNNRIKSFNALERRLETIRDGDSIALFQVRKVYGAIGSSTGASSGASTIGDNSVDVEAATLHNTLVNSGVGTAADTTHSIHTTPPTLPTVPTSLHIKPRSAEGVFDAETLYHNYNNSDQWVRVAFTQRRARMHDAAIYNNNPSTNTNTEYSILGNGMFGNTFTVNSNTTSMNNSSSGSSPDYTSTANNTTSTTYNGGIGSDTEYFKLEAFGISALEVLPNRIRCGDLYKLVAQKYAAYIKVPIAQLIRHRRQQRDSQRQALKHSTSAQSLNSGMKGGLHNTSNSSLGSNDPTEDYPVNLRTTQVCPGESDEVLGGAIPAHGFTLRLVNGGTGVHTVCSRCPWLRHCDGCVLPEHSEVDVELRDGESIAIDWHFEVYETVLDTVAVSSVRRHDADMNLPSIHTPLSTCFAKFTEQEPLDDIVCPTCKECTLHKALTLWRLPPVLIVQLKRFKYDRTSRRKLNNHVDFPMYDLDVYDYLASGRQASVSRSRAATLDAAEVTTSVHENHNTSTTSTSTGTSSGISDANHGNSAAQDALAMAALYGDSSPPPSSTSTYANTVSTSTTNTSANHTTSTTNTTANNITDTTTNTNSTLVLDSELCTHYDLYSVVHHAGALGGGHYATTCRALNMRGSGGGSTNGSNDSTTSTSNGTTNTTNTTNTNTNANNTVNEDQWYCYNDNLVTTIHSSEICAPSAYLLFYMRKDMRQGDVLALLRRQLSLPVVLSEKVIYSSSSDSVEGHMSDESSVVGSVAEGEGGNVSPNGSIANGSVVSDSSSAGYTSNNSVVDEPLGDDNTGDGWNSSGSADISTANTTDTDTANIITTTTNTTNATNTNSTNTTTSTNTTALPTKNSVTHTGFSGFIDDCDHNTTNTTNTTQHTHNTNTTTSTATSTARSNTTSSGRNNTNGATSSKKEDSGCIPS